MHHFVTRVLLMFTLGLFSVAAVRAADSPTGTWTLHSPDPIEEVYTAVYQALEAEQFWVVFEADMGARMARFADRWGNDYNRNGLGAVKSMVFCNIWWTNRMANAHPDMLGTCPLHITIYEKDGRTTVILPRPTALAGDGPEAAKAAARELEKELTTLVERALRPTP
ncbi:MAG: DUF302 domain-containing protein [Gammaproteobacteria bacterium]